VPCRGHTVLNRTDYLFQPIVEAVSPAAIEMTNEMGAKFDEIMPAIGEQVAALLTQGIEAYNEGELGSFLAGLLVKAWTDYVQPEIDKWSALFFTWLDQTIADLPNRLTELTDLISAKLVEYGPTIQEEVIKWKDLFFEWIGQTVSELGTRMGEIVAGIETWANSPDTQAKLQEMGNTLGEMLLSGLADLAGDEASMVETLTAIADGLLGAIGSILTSLVTVGAEILAGIIEGILESAGVDVEPALVSELDDIFSGMADNIKTIAKVIGTNIVEGIKTGITDAKDKVTTAITDIATGALDTIKDVLGIGSPAKAFIDIGLNIMEGLAGGITENIGKVLGALGSVGKSLLGGLFGGDDEGSSLDLGDLLMNLVTGIPEAIENLKIGFTELWTILNEQVVGLVIEQALVPLVALLVQLYTVHIPTLQTVWTAANEAITSSTFPVHDAIRLIITLLGQASQAVKQLALDFKAAMDDIADSMEDAADGIGELVDRIDEAAEAFRKMAEAAKEAASASDAAGSTAPGGAGFQHGTGLSGFRVPGPGGRPFPLTVHGGEVVEVMPAGAARQARRSGDGGGNTWNVTINATDTVGGVEHSLMTLMALVGGSSG